MKLPLKDENGNGGLGAGKTGFKTVGRNNENALTGKKGGLGGQNAFVTPVAQKNRAPLGMKTTNAKTRAFQTPAPIREGGKGEKDQKSVSARKAKPRVSHAEMTKLDMLGDHAAFEEREIEYMPPKPNGKDVALLQPKEMLTESRFTRYPGRHSTSGLLNS